MKKLKVIGLLIAVMLLLSCENTANTTRPASTDNKSLNSIAEKESVREDSASETESELSVERSYGGFEEAIQGIEIVEDAVADFDNDGTKERLILGVDPTLEGEFPDGLPAFTMILLSQLQQDATPKVIFDSRASEVHVAGVDRIEHTAPAYFERYEMGEHSFDQEGLFETGDLNRNGLTEFYFQNEGFPSMPPRTLILEMKKDHVQVLLDATLRSFNYKDFDGDGILELYGVTYEGYSQRSPFGFNEVTVFELKQGLYKPSEERTKLYYKQHFEQMTQKVSEGVSSQEVESIVLTLIADSGFLLDEASGIELIHRYLDILLQSSVINNYIPIPDPEDRLAAEQHFIKVLQQEMEQNRKWYERMH